MMSESIFGHKIIFRFSGCDDGGNYVINLLHCRIGKKDWFHVGICDADMLHPVFLLVAAGEFVLFDHTVQVIIHRCAPNDTVLGASFHGLGVDVEVFLFILPEPAIFLEQFEIVQCLLVNLRTVFIDPRWKINLRFYNVKQR